MIYPFSGVNDTHTCTLTHSVSVPIQVVAGKYRNVVNEAWRQWREGEVCVLSVARGHLLLPVHS